MVEKPREKIMSAKIQALRSNLQNEMGTRFIFGNEDLIDTLLIAWLARGHVLIEGPPGTGKTLSAKVFSHLLAHSFKRIQFTSDMLPGDIIGAPIYKPQSQSFEFLKGPLFSDCILADEINRTPPRTQSALLEAMEERQVTVEGERYELSPEFFVIATQNPQDFEGTFPLPEAQTDRFLFKVTLTHSTPDVESQVIRSALGTSAGQSIRDLKPIALSRSELDAEILAVKVDDSILAYVARILALTRSHPLLSYGASVRGGIALVRSARILAAIAGRSFVTVDDIKFLSLPVLRHRVRLSAEAQMGGENEDQVISEIMTKTEFPK
jgi:MoxR-like ATPase